MDLFCRTHLATGHARAGFPLHCVASKQRSTPFSIHQTAIRSACRVTAGRASITKRRPQPTSSSVPTSPHPLHHPPSVTADESVTMKLNLLLALLLSSAGAAEQAKCEDAAFVCLFDYEW